MPRRPISQLIVGALAVAAVGSCELVYSFDVGSPGAADATTEGAAMGDAPPDTDATADASPDADAPSTPPDAAPEGPYCASLDAQPAFCCDFDETIVLCGLTLSAQCPVDAGVLEGVSDALASSPPNSFFVFTPPEEAGSWQCGAEKYVKGHAHWHLDFDFYFDALDQVDQTRIDLAVLNAGSTYAIRFYFGAPESNLNEVVPTDGGYTSINHLVSLQAMQQIKAQQWHRVSLRGDVLDAGVSNVDVLFDGTSIKNPMDTTPWSFHDYYKLTTLFSVGSTGDAPTAGWSIRIDNVVFDGFD